MYSNFEVRSSFSIRQRINHLDIRVVGYSVVWDYDPTPHIFPKEHQKERCGHSRSQRSFITFHGALWNILLSADSFTVFSKIPSNLIFVNGAFE